MRSAALPDPWCFSCFDDFNGRIARVKDHIGEEPFARGCKTLCGRSVVPHGYPIADSDPAANYFCKSCRKAAARRGIDLGLPDDPYRCACGGRKSDTRVERCQECLRSRRRTVEKMWSEGKTMPHIAAAVEMTVDTLSVVMAEMRRQPEVYFLPHRRADKTR